MTIEKDILGPRTAGFLIHDARLADRYLARVEATLKSISEVKTLVISSGTDPKLNRCSILIVFANNLDDQQMVTWVKGIAKRLDPESINIPWLIICESSEGVQKELLRYALDENWYFDLVSPEHLDSLTTRIGSLIRISDHISEIHRYDAEIKTLETQVALALEKIDTLQKTAGS